MKAWFTSAEIAAAAQGALPGTVRGINMLADKRGWREQPDKARRRADGFGGRGGGWEYHVSLLPGDVQVRLKIAQHETPLPDRHERVERDEMWRRYHALARDQKAVCENRLKMLAEIEDRVRAGLGETAAAKMVARANGISTATLFNWKARVRSVDRADWLAALAPEWKGAANRADVHPEAWALLKSDCLRPEKPGFSACYRRMKKAADRNGWEPIPSERALRRRLDAEVPPEVRVLAREGRDKAKSLYPAQRRTRAHFHAMQAVNADGHKLDIFARFDDGRIGRPHLVAIQDLFSGKVIAYRLAESENKHDVRLAIGDMVERFGIPEKMWLDNGRAFASKWITGGTANRYRFKVRDEDPAGLLTTLGVEIHWTTPYSGQSKPIERAFRDLAEEIAKHPICAGAYTGNRPDAKPENYGNAAIPIDMLRAHVQAQIAEHNARPGRRTETAKGRSFDETFATSMAAPTTIVRWPTDAQRALWLLAAERVHAQKGSGELHLFGNRYWSEELNARAGTKVTVRFDPGDLTRGVSVYDNEERLICVATLIENARFDDVETAGKHAAKRNAYLRAAREKQRLHAELTAEELASIYAEDSPPEQRPMKPAVQRIASGGGNAARQAEWDDEREASFARGLRLVGGSDLDV